MTEPLQDNHLVLLGSIAGQQEAHGQLLKDHGDLLRSIDGRLRTQEQKAVLSGAVSGGVISIGVALLVEGLKDWMRRGGGRA